MQHAIELSATLVHSSAWDSILRSDSVHMTPPGTNVVLGHLSILLTNRESLVNDIFALYSRNKVQLDTGERGCKCQSIALIGALRQVDDEDLLELQGTVSVSLVGCGVESNDYGPLASHSV